MYNSRSSNFQRQILREDSVAISEPPSLAASREPSPSESVQRQPSTLESVQGLPSAFASVQRESSSSGSGRTKRYKPDTFTQPDEPAPNRNMLYRKAEFKNQKELKLTQKLSWNPYPEKIVLELRNILADSYDKSLNAVAGSSEDNMNEDLKRDLKNLARGVNKAVKGLLVPGVVDDNLLDPRMSNVKLKQLANIKAQKLALAKDELYLEHCERILENKNAELESLEEQLQQEKDRLATQKYQKATVPQDYIHSLIMEPSSSFFF